MTITEAIDFIESAVEKQVEKKPVLRSGTSVMAVDYADGHGEVKREKWQAWLCPVCEGFVGQRYNISQTKAHNQSKSQYCPKCGQKIDWSESNETN